MIVSRSRQLYMNSVSNPASWAATPSQSRWLWIRSISANIVRMAWARGGTVTPASFSTPRAYAVAWMWEQMPQMRSMR